MEMIDIVNKLIGPIQPVGESNEDEKRLKNLKDFIELTDNMIDELKSVHDHSNSHQSSLILVRKTIRTFLNNLKTEI